VKASQLLTIARRYTFAWRRGYLSSFLSLLSIVGMVLAIALLILVLSVMNGFDREMRENILSMVPQLTMRSWVPLEDWRASAAQIAQHPEVQAVSPYVQLQGMLVHENAIDTTLVFGVSAEAEQGQGGLRRALGEASWQQFLEVPNGILLGKALANKLAVQPGNALTLIVPGPGMSQQGAQFKHLLFVGEIDTGTELDESAAFMHLELAATLAGEAGGVDGFRLQLTDLFAAPRIGWELVNSLPSGYYATDWTQTHGNLYSAIQMSRSMVVILLFSIIAIAAFNIVSSLVLVVVDKRSDIAILRAMGASPRDINGIFIQQGLLIALVGSGIGSVLGVVASYTVTDLVAALESALGIRFLNTDVYPIGYLPSDLRVEDVVMINLVAFLLCFLASLYPARRAAQLPPAEALRHE